MSCLSLDELIYLTSRKKRAKDRKVMIREVIETIQKTVGKKNKSKNNSFIHPCPPRLLLDMILSS
jgi:hypothetical protein